MNKPTALFFGFIFSIGAAAGGGTRPRPEPVTAWNPAIPQQTLVCFTSSPETPYYTVTATDWSTDPWITIEVLPTFYRVTIRDHAGIPDIVLHLPLAGCIYREAGGVTP